MTVTTPDGGAEQHAPRTVIWVAGVTPSRLAGALAQAGGGRLDRAGRLVVEADLTVAGHPEVLALGDMIAICRGDQVEALPGVAPVAMQQGPPRRSRRARQAAAVLLLPQQGQPGDDRPRTSRRRPQGGPPQRSAGVDHLAWGATVAAPGSSAARPRSPSRSTPRERRHDRARPISGTSRRRPRRAGLLCRSIMWEQWPRRTPRRFKSCVHDCSDRLCRENALSRTSLRATRQRGCSVGRPLASAAARSRWS